MTISQAEAEAMGLVKVTKDEINACSIIDTIRGPMTAMEWCCRLCLESEHWPAREVVLDEDRNFVSVWVGEKRRETQGRFDSGDELPKRGSDRRMERHRKLLEH